MAQPNCEELDPTDTPCTVPTTIQTSIDNPFNPWCAHNPMETQGNQSQCSKTNHNFAYPN